MDIDRTYFSSAAQKLFQGFEAHHKSKRVSASREMLKSKFDNNSMLHSYRLGLLTCITRHIISRQMNVTQENQSEQHVENTLNESSQQFGSVRTPTCWSSFSKQYGLYVLRTRNRDTAKTARKLAATSVAQSQLQNRTQFLKIVD